MRLCSRNGSHNVLFFILLGMRNDQIFGSSSRHTAPAVVRARRQLTSVGLRQIKIFINSEAFIGLLTSRSPALISRRAVRLTSHSSLSSSACLRRPGLLSGTPASRLPGQPAGRSALAPCSGGAARRAPQRDGRQTHGEGPHAGAVRPLGRAAGGVKHATRAGSFKHCG